jgi:hypothetical protein
MTTRPIRVLVVSMAATLAACGTSPSDGSTVGPIRSLTAAPSTSRIASAELAKEKAKSAYVAMWRDVAAAAVTSDWQSPHLADHATGEALSVISKAMYADHYKGLVTKGAPKNQPSVSSVDSAVIPTTVMISDCGDSTNWLKYKADTGQLADDIPGGRRSITAEVKHQADGSWKVARFAVEGLGTC